MMKSQKRIALITAALMPSLACHEMDNGGPAGPAPVESFDATTAREWFDLLTVLIDDENLNPPEASRRIGYAGVAFYEGLVAGTSGHRSLGGQLNGLGTLPAPPPGPIHWPAAANHATALVLANLFATAAGPTLTKIATKETDLETLFALDTATLDNSTVHGQAIADAIIAWSTGDGYTTWNDCSFTPPVGAGLWEPTPPTFTLNPLEPCWGNLRTFALQFAAECATVAHPPFSKTGGSAFALEAQEVFDTVNSLTSGQQDIARFWADGAGSLTPPGHWVSIAGQVLVSQSQTLDVAAEAYAKVGIAVADAFITCWQTKFAHNLLRPITYIRDPTGPINAPTWTSFIGTPPFPEYTSGHSTQSAAAAAVLTDLLGANVVFTDRTHQNDAIGLVPPPFSSFDAAADEAAISRLYGGIHYRAAIDRGLEQGRCIGQVIRDNIQFRN